MGHLSQVVELSSMLPHNALKVYKQTLTPHPKVSRGWGCCVRQHDNVAREVVKALHAILLVLSSFQYLASVHTLTGAASLA